VNDAGLALSIAAPCSVLLQIRYGLTETPTVTQGSNGGFVSVGVQGDVVPIGYTGVPPIPASDIPAYNASASSCVVSLAPCPPEAATPLCQWPTCAAIGCVNAHWHSVESCISLVWCVLCVVAGTTFRAKCPRTPSSAPSGPTGMQVGDADPKCALFCLIDGGSPKCESEGVWPPPVDVHV
jgi:hypothetical protein